MNIMMKKILDVENEEWKIKQNKIEKYRCDNREKTIENVKNKKESDLNFKLACNLRSGTSSAFKCQKTNETFDLLGCSHSFFRRFIIINYGNLTIENYGSLWQIDHCLQLASFNLLNENEMKKMF